MGNCYIIYYRIPYHDSILIDLMLVGLQPEFAYRISVNQLRNNSTVFEELEVSIVDLMVANAVLLATDICDRQIHN